ncbi:MAG: cytochrome c oxidase subunit II [Tepidisphaeraceae bacterium]
MVSIPTVSLLGSAENFVMTRGASSVAPEIDWLMYFILWVCVIFGTLIFVGTAWLAWRYRHKPGVNDIGHGPTHSNLLEIVWSVIPLIIVMLIAIWGFQGYMNLAILPPNNDADTIEINVTAFKWGWSFEYPNGHSEPTLHVPVNTKIRLVLTSQDVIHSLYFPQFRVKKDVVPGRYNKFWFEATETSPIKEGLNPSEASSYDPDAGGDANAGFDIFCAEYCGQGHSRMRSKVVVHPDRASYEAWLKEVSDVYRKINGVEPKAKDVGLKLVKNGGCFACHSVDGSKGTGPTWKNMYGAPVSFSDGSSIPEVDENYVHESILYPQAKLVAGFGPAMPSYLGKFSDRDISAIIAYMKSISDAYKGPKDALDQPVPPTSAPAKK